MERESAWKRYDEDQLAELEQLGCKLHRFHFREQNRARVRRCGHPQRRGRGLRKPGRCHRCRSQACSRRQGVGEPCAARPSFWCSWAPRPLTEGMNILGAHIDSPRLDVKQNPLYESNDFALPGHATTTAASSTTSGSRMPAGAARRGGEDGRQRGGREDRRRPGRPGVLRVRPAHSPGESADGQEGQRGCGRRGALDVLGRQPPAGGAAEPDRRAGARGLPEGAGEGVRAQAAGNEKYGIERRGLPVRRAGSGAGWTRPRPGLRPLHGASATARTTACAPTRRWWRSWPLPTTSLDRTGVCVLVDKEEIGSVGATGMASRFFENTIAEIMELAGEGGIAAAAPRAGAPPRMLSSDVSAGLRSGLRQRIRGEEQRLPGPRPGVQQVHRRARQEQAATTPRAEYVARIRKHHGRRRRAVPDLPSWAASTLAAAEPSRTSPRSTAWTSSTRAWPCFPMHSPWEATSKADIYEAERGYEAFLARLTYANTGSKKPPQLRGLYSLTHLLGTNPRPTNVSEEPEGARNHPAAAPSVLRYAQRAVQRATPGAIGLHSVEQIRRPAGRRNS